MGAFVFVLFILALIGILVWQFIETRNALATTSVRTRLSPDQVMQVIDSAFGGARSVLWTNDKGPGTINKRRRGYRHGITMSIDVEPQPDGSTQVSMWASSYTQYMVLLANMAGVVNRRKKAIAGLLLQPAGQPSVPASLPGYPAPDQVADPNYR